MGAAEHNIVQILLQKGLSQQQAYGRVGVLMHNRFRAWYIAQSEIPLYGEEIDKQVMLYVKACQDAVVGNLNWRYVILPTPCLSNFFILVQFSLFPSSPSSTSSCNSPLRFFLRDFFGARDKKYGIYMQRNDSTEERGTRLANAVFFCFKKNSFRSERYFGKESKVVRKTRMVNTVD